MHFSLIKFMREVKVTVFYCINKTNNVNLLRLVLTVFLLIKFTQEVKVIIICYRRIKHGSFLSLCIGDNP